MKILPITDEKELLQKLRDGDQMAFAKLYLKYSEKLASNLFRLLKSWEEAEEALQELFVRIWEHRENINPEKSFQAYLFRIAGNLVNDYYRKVAQDKKLQNELWMHLTSLHYTDTLKQQILEDEELMRTIEKLPPQRKVVFKLCKLEGKTHSEVSNILAISESAVNDHVTKANRFLREHYDKTIPLLALLLALETPTYL